MGMLAKPASLRILTIMPLRGSCSGCSEHRSKVKENRKPQAGFQERFACSYLMGFVPNRQEKRIS